jgi:Xaa-Pro aminopeptidase
MTPAEERDLKLQRVREYLEARGLGGVLLTTTANFAWLTGGASNHVGQASETGAASLLVTGEACVLIASNIEMPRLEAEGLGDEDVTREVFPWYAPDLSGIAARYAGGHVASDTPVDGAEPLPSDFAALRYALLPPEVERYRWLGEHAALCMTRACFEARPGLSEHQIAGMLAGDLQAFGITPTLLLVGADERACRFRHPIPTERALEAHLLLAVGARRWGLIVSMTRLVHFGPPPPELLRRQEAVATVDAVLHRATQPGARVAEIFAAGCRAYVEAGFPDAWREHHQGGATGYAPREYRATAASEMAVQPQQAFAWNPALWGAKSEDTLLAAPGGPEVLTITPDLPVLRVELDGSVVERPGLLCR